MYFYGEEIHVFFFFLNKICKGIYKLCINGNCWKDGSFHDNFTCFPKLLWMRLQWVSLPPHQLHLPSGFLLKESSFDFHWKLLPLLCHLTCTWGFDEKIPLLQRHMDFLHLILPAHRWKFVFITIDCTEGPSALQSVLISFCCSS